MVKSFNEWLNEGENDIVLHFKVTGKKLKEFSKYNEEETISSAFWDSFNGLNISLGDTDFKSFVNIDNNTVTLKNVDIEQVLSVLNDDNLDWTLDEDDTFTIVWDL